MAGRNIAKLQGGPKDGDTETMTETHVRLRWPGVAGSYVFFAVDPKYPRLYHYRWEDVK